MVTKCLLILLLIFLLCMCVLCFPKRIHIAGLFHEDEAIQHMFKSSIRAINIERHGNEELSNVFLIPETFEIEMDLFEVSMKVCDLINKVGIVGIFGPQEKECAEHVQSICDIMEIPHISIRQDTSQPSHLRGLGLNLYPHVSALSRIYDQLVTEFKWKAFAVLYENTDSLVRLHLLLKRWDAQGNSAFVYHLGYGPNYRQAMQEIKASEIENIIIDCSSHVLEEVLKQAQQVGILSDKHKLIVTSLDLQTLDLEPYQYSGVKFTGLRLIDPEDLIVQQTLDKHKNEWGLDNPSQLRVEPALMYDAVQLFARAFKQLKDATKGDVKKLPCNGSERWEHGLSLSNFMRSTETRGLTGLVKFDRNGFRSNIQLDIVHLTENGLVKIGVWNSTPGNSIDWVSDNTKKTRIEQSLEQSLRSKTFIVLISLTEPYGMLKKSWKKLVGNDRYEGFVIDIIQQISDILGFNYTLQVESNYGSFNFGNHSWSGMLGKIIADEADLAITDLTITSLRASAVDFTMPIMNLGISILYKPKVPQGLLLFLSPFSKDVWIYLIGAYVTVSLTIFVAGRLCPAEWKKPHSCIEEAEELTNQFTFKNSFYFAIGAIMQQGSDIAPIGISTRMMASFYWFFCLIIVSSYTANLIAFFTVRKPPFDNIEELVHKTTIKYGATYGGATFHFFKKSNHSTHQQMYKYMLENKNEVLPLETEDGVNKVKFEDYAFLMESSSIEYIIQRECNLVQIGGLLSEKSFGIAMKRHSPYRGIFNSAILRLSESSLLKETKKKWWTEKRDGNKCQENGGANLAKLNLDNVGGVFLVLTAGVALSTVYTVIELLWDVAQTSIRENVSFKDKLISELKFILKCSGSKPVQRKNRLSSKNENGNTGERTPPYAVIPTVTRTSPADDE